MKNKIDSLSEHTYMIAHFSNLCYTIDMNKDKIKKIMLQDQSFDILKRHEYFVIYNSLHLNNQITT